ncbi:helix-turn-helix domain-containing protein [Kitasatospora sp. NPDC002227]|uniref:helix-turn-helix domain-containing protein n=1 Tax=Kitasatospora sp. NPDC002227 TaxID=3154773 RepID=UPI0033247F07
MEQLYYSVDQVAALLGLHVRTVRAYVRDGRLRATQVGRQYRITREDLAAFTGLPAPAGAGRRHTEASSVVQVEAVSPAEAMRISNTAVALAQSRRGGEEDGPLRVESVYDEGRATLKLIIIGGLETTAELLNVVHTLTTDNR